MQVDINTKNSKKNDKLQVQGFNPKAFAAPKRASTQAQIYILDPSERKKKEDQIPPELKLQKHKSRDNQMNDTQMLPSQEMINEMSKIKHHCKFKDMFNDESGDLPEMKYKKGASVFIHAATEEMTSNLPKKKSSLKLDSSDIDIPTQNNNKILLLSSKNLNNNTSVYNSPNNRNSEYQDESELNEYVMGKSKIFVTNSDVKIRKNSKTRVNVYGQVKGKKKGALQARFEHNIKVQSAQSFDESQANDHAEMDFSQKVMYEHQ